MPKSTSERIAEYRARRKAEGLVTVTVVVPESDAGLFNQFAAERRDAYRKGKLPASTPRQQWLAMLAALTPGIAQPAPPRRPRSTLGTRISRAETLVAAILKHIIDRGWPVGMPLGSEQELMKTHGVSRTVLRQAIRLLDHHSIAQMQRGAGGGLVVAQPDLGATMRAVGVYLEYAGIGPRNILATRRLLELATMDLAIERLDAAGEQRLRDQMAAEARLDGRAGADELLRFHLLLGELCGDPALRLFGAIALQLADAHSTFHRRSREDRDAVVERIKRLHQEIAQAVIARERDRAQTLMTRYIAGIEAWLE
jgi:DNA-binding FadR family transcriptional regulator